MGKRLIIKGADFSVNSLIVAPTISITTDGVVTLTAAGATSIHYTTDGSTPTSSSTAYSQAFTVASGTTVKAIAIYASGTSDVSSATYNYNPAVIEAEEQIEHAELMIDYSGNAIQKRIGKAATGANTRATVLMPVAYETKEAPLAYNALDGSYTCICMPDGINKVSIKMTNSDYYFGLALFDVSNDYDSGWIQGGQDAETSYEPDTKFSGDCWLMCTLKKGSAGTGQFTNETIESLGLEISVE